MTKRAAPEGLLRAERVRMLETELAPRMRDWGIARARTFDAFVRANATLLDKRPTDDTARVTLDEVAIAEYKAAADDINALMPPLPAGKPSLGALMHDQVDRIKYFSFDTILERLCSCVDEIAAADEEDTITWLYVNKRTHKSNAWFAAYLWHKTSLRTDFVITTAVRPACVEMLERHGFRRHRILYVDDGTFSGMQLSMAIETAVDGADDANSNIVLVPVVAFVTPDAREGVPEWIFPATVEWLSASISLPAYGRTLLSHDLEPQGNEPSVYLAVLKQWTTTAHRDWLIVCEHKLADDVSINSEFLLHPFVPVTAEKGVHSRSLVHIRGTLGFKNDKERMGTVAFYRALQWYTSADASVPTDSVPLNALVAFAAAAAVAPLACAVCAAPATQRCTQCGLAAYCANGSGCQRMHWQALGHADACTRYAHKTHK
jgi:hypothetical protein